MLPIIGFVTLSVLTKDTENIFKCGIAVAPVTNWIYYDTIYTERYLGLPEDNFSGYAASSLVNGGYAGGGAMGSEGPRSLALAAPSRGMSSKELGEELGEVSKKLGGATEKLGEVSEKLGEELGEVSEKLGEELGEKLDRVTEKLSKLDEVTEKLGEVSCKLDGVTEKLTKLVGTMDTMARSDAAWWGVAGQDQQWWPPWEGEAQAAEAAEEGPPKTMKLQ